MPATHDHQVQEEAAAEDEQMNKLSRGCRILADRGSRGDKFVIRSSLGHQFIVCAFFYDRPTRHHCYDVSSLDCRQPVSDDDTSSSFSGFVQSRLDGLQKRKAS